MSEENTVDFAEYAKKFGKAPNAKKSGIRAELSKRSFPNEWKIICLQILQHLQESVRQELGHKRRGWGDLRDQIMKDFDEGHPEGFDPRLTRQHLEHWENGSKMPDERFRFVDRFVTLLDNPESEACAGDKIIEDRDRYFARVFSDTYQVRRFDDDTVRLVTFASGYGLISEKISNSWFQYVAIKFGVNEAGVLKATVAYCAFDVFDENAFDKKLVLFTEAFVVPIVDFQLQEESILARMGSDVKVLERRCLLKQIRPQFRGSAIRGYACGELQFIFSNFPHGGDKYRLTVHLDHPNTSVSPSLNLDMRSNRFLNRVDPIQEEYLDGFDFEDNGELKFSREYRSEEAHRYKYKLTPHSEAPEKIDKIFENGYRGFLF